MAERQYRTLIETAPDAIVTIDETSTIVLVNPAVTRIFGYTPAELIGRSLTVLMPERFASRHLASVGRYIETGRRHVSWAGLELTALRKNGEEFPVEISFAEVGRPDRRMFTGFIRDITERKRLLEAQGELARISRFALLGEFAAAIAHEVRQPLTAIMMNARTCLRLLAAAPPDLQEVRVVLTELVEAGHRAGEVIRRNRKLVEKHTVHKTPLDINDVVRDVAVLVTPRLRANHIACTTTLSAVPEISGDRVELQQVLLNLIANGIDAMERNDSSSRLLQVATCLAPDGMVRVSVADNGVGLDGIDADRIFSLFYTTKPKGTGVGLSISRSIVEAHGGQLRAEQNATGGATFSFTLPVLAPAAGDPA